PFPADRGSGSAQEIRKKNRTWSASRRTSVGTLLQFQGWTLGLRLDNEVTALTIRFADFEIDTARQELRRAGAIVHIEPQVFDLLVHLVRNRDRIVRKDELIDVIWQGRIVSEAALSSRISAARRALGDSGSDQSLIRTLHKRGFR